MTGASRGIGAAVAKALAHAGAHVILLARTESALCDVHDEIAENGGHATILAMDLSKLEDTDKIGPTIMDRFGRLDILIANAGILGPLSPVSHIPMKDWDSVLNTNLIANIRLVRTLDPVLRQSDAGRIIFTSSHLAAENAAYWGPYCTSKAALDAFMRCYAEETRQTNLRINSIYPGGIDTEMLKEAFPGGTPFNPKQPAEIVQAYLELCEPSCEQHGSIIALD